MLKPDGVKLSRSKDWAAHRPTKPKLASLKFLGVSELEADREEICGMFGYLNDKQRKTILKLADMLASSNRKIQELENGIE